MITAVAVQIDNNYSYGAKGANIMIQEIIRELGQSSLLIFAAEMGDKTQILAMAFALQFSIGQVLSGVAIGSFLNHGIAVALGAYLAQIVPLDSIRFVAALLFIGFGLWTLSQREEDDEQAKTENGHPIFTVAMAFFIGELGDKTQLAAIALSSNADFPLAVLAGTVLGMVLTSLVGILVGIKLGERIPELALKLISSGVFIVFGLYGLWQTVPSEFLTSQNIILFLLALGAIIAILIIPLLRLRKKGSIGQLQRAAGDLRAQLLEIDRAVQAICLGLEQCGQCRGERCPVGYCKKIVGQAIRGEAGLDKAARTIPPYVKRSQHFDEEKVQKALALLQESILKNKDEDIQDCVLANVRAALEIIQHPRP